MRIRVEHETRYVYEEPVRALIQTLRMTPRSHVGQHVLRWRIEPSLEGALAQGEDALGNIVHRFAADLPADALTIRVVGEVETDDAAGVVRGAVERAPDLYWLRETALTAPSPELAAFADEAAGADRSDPLALLHRLAAAVHERVACDADPEAVATSAADAFAAGRGVAQDVAHVFVACARRLRAPARVVTGYVVRPDGSAGRETAHSWAEAKAPGLGWVAFDPALGVCATPAHVRVAVGLDRLGAAPIRGSRYGGGAERLSVRLAVTEAASQTQSQS